MIATVQSVPCSQPCRAADEETWLCRTHIRTPGSHNNCTRDFQLPTDAAKRNLMPECAHVFE